MSEGVTLLFFVILFSTLFWACVLKLLIVTITLQEHTVLLLHQRLHQVIFLTGEAGLQLLHLPLLHKLLHPSDSHVVLHGEGGEGGDQVAGEEKAESVETL